MHSETNVHDIHKGKTFTWAYCSCGCEVKETQKQSRYCGKELIWEQGKKNL